MYAKIENCGKIPETVRGTGTGVGTGKRISKP
jgi:hypothetical protein